jgi:abequosyltransferase
MKPRLSICVPTYNRADMLGALIESVIRQAAPDVEIVISDNASTDGTQQLVRDWQSRYDRLVYDRSPENLGPDRNYLRAVDLAQGDYCWLMGSDDALAPGACECVMPLLQAGADVIITDRADRCRALREPLGRETILNAPHGASFECSRPGELLRYLKAARTFTAVFPYLSNLIVRRAAWHAQPTLEQFLGSAWMHSSKVMCMVRAGAKIVYAKQPAVWHRTGNDFFLHSGHARRALIDVNYLNVARESLQADVACMDRMTQILYRHSFNLLNLMSTRRHCFYDEPHNVRLLEAEYHRAFSKLPGYGPKMLLWRMSSPRLLNALHRHKGLILKLWPAA